MDSQRRNEALKSYLAALSIHPSNAQRFFILKSKVCMARGSWKDALDHANEVSFIVSRKFSLVDVQSSGDSIRSIVTMGLRGETCGFAWGRML